MSRFVLALHDAGGTVPPMLAVAQALIARGHAVTVLGQQCIERRARDVGCEFVAFRVPDYSKDRPIEEQVEAVIPMMTGRGPAEDLVRTIEASRADGVVVDANLAGVAAAAEAVPCRSTILLHSLYSTYIDTWFGELWPFLEPAINETRAAFGLAAGSSWTDIFLPHDRLYAAVPAIFDAPTTITPPATLRHTGFLVPAATGSDATFDADERIVLVSLSTTEMAQGPLLQAILDALDGEEVRGIVTTGGQRFESRLRVPPNVVVHDYLAHATVLPHAVAAITHAGLGTIAAALGHGVPLVCTPIARDQPLNASRVSELGAGITVPASAAAPTNVRAALHEVLTNVRFRQGAEHVAAASTRAGGALAVVDDLERLTR